MHGGPRPGAGRKPGFAAKNAEEARKYLSQRVSEEIESFTDILIKKAKDGDLKAMQMLLDRAWGRSKQEVHLQQHFEKTAPSTRILELARNLNPIS